MQLFEEYNRLLYESIQNGDEILVDEIAFKKALDGDGESFYKLLVPIKDKLYKVAYVYLRNENDTLDCIHEAIIKAIQSLDTLKEPQYFNTWMMKITINKCKDYIKKNNKVVLVDIENYKDIIVIEEEQFECVENITDALNKLSDKEREFIVMRYLKDMPLKEISNITTTPLGTIKSNISRTLRKMKKYMEEVKQ